MARTVVGVLRGGISNEYPLSLKTGGAMLAELPEHQFETKDILIDRNGMWYMRGMPTDPARAFSQVDVVLNGLHGGVGEDGTVQRLLERASVPYYGSRALASGLALNKIRSRELLQRAGVRMPRAVSFSSNIVDLPDAIGDVLDAYGAAVIEEYVIGDEASVAILQEFRGDALYALPPAHVMVPKGATHLTFDAHHAGLLRHVCPSHFSHKEKEALIDIARAAHKALGMSHVSRSDIILTENGPYLLEINALPGLYQGASLPPMLESVGSSVSQ